MLQYVIRRVAYLFLVVLAASTLVFILIRVIPGDPAQLMAGEYVDAEQLEKIRSDLGIDQPIYKQYAIWLRDLVRGDFGRSFRNNELVAVELLNRAPATIELAFASLLIGIPTGILLGVLAAAHRLSWIDNIVMLISVVGIAVPVFWTGLMLILLFSVELKWLPLGGRIGATSIVTGPTGFIILDGILTKRPSLSWEALKHLVLPAVTLSWFPLATVARVTRSSMLEALGQDFVRTAHSKGVPWRGVVYRHALRNALIPVITIVGISIGPLVGGAVLTETVFAWPGLGRYVVQSIYGRDFPAIQAIVFLSALVFSTANLLADLSYAFVDPRIRYRR